MAQEHREFCFLSYSRKNNGIVEEIVSELEKKGIKVYIDYRDIPPGSIYAEEIVNAIESSICCILVFTEDSNTSGYVLNEMNSAANYNKPIIPLRLDKNVFPGKALEFYIGKHNWIDYCGLDSLEKLIETINRIGNKEKHKADIKYVGPIVKSGEELEEIGYTVEKKVIETIEIDYRTLNEAPNEYELTDETEGTTYDWIDYAKSYPETSSMLIMNDRIVGYYQLMLVDETNYNSIISGQEMVKASMQEFYGFGGDFYCYIAVMPIIKTYETQSNYMMLLNEFISKIVKFHNDGINIKKFGISVYTPLLETMMKTLGFKTVGTNKVGGKIMELSLETIRSSLIFKNKYPDFYRIYGGTL